MLVEQAGRHGADRAGAGANLKVTTPADLRLAELLLAAPRASATVSSDVLSVALPAAAAERQPGGLARLVVQVGAPAAHVEQPLDVERRRSPASKIAARLSASCSIAPRHSAHSA